LKKIVFTTVVTVSLLASPVYAEVTIYGAGGISCGTWIAERKNDTGLCT